MSSKSPYDKFCPDCGVRVPTRYAVRCKSCAAKERHRMGLYDANQLAQARVNSLISRTGFAEPRDKRCKNVAIDSDALRKAIERNGYTLRDIARTFGKHDSTIGIALTRGTMDADLLDSISCLLLCHYTEFIREDAA